MAKTTSKPGKKKIREEMERMAEAFINVLPGEKQSLLQGWIEKVAKKNPARAADLALAALEYTTPKQARVESVGDDGGPLAVIVQTTPPVCPTCSVRHDPAGSHVTSLQGGTVQ